MTVVQSPGTSSAQRRSGAFGYYLAVAAGALLASAFSDPQMGPTFLWMIVTWGVVSLVAVPGRTAAGQGFFVAVTTTLLVRDYSQLTLDAKLWAVANLVVLLSVFWIQPLRRTKGFPFLHLWCLVESIYVYVSSMLSTPPGAYRYVFTPEVRATGYRTLLLFTTLMVLAGVVTIRLSSGTKRSEDLPTPTPPPTSAIGRAYALIALSGGLVVFSSVAGLESRLGSMNQALQLIGYGGGLVLGMLWLSGRLPLRHKIVVMAMGGFIALLGLGAGALYASATPGFLVLALVLAQKRRVPWTAMLAVLSVLLLLNINKGEFRQETWYGESNESATTLGLDWIEKTTSNLDEATDEKISHSAHRFGNSDVLGYIVTWVPDRYDYFGYESFTSVPYVLIPRILLPDKPAFNLENQFGRQYELISRSDFNTTVNTPLHVESFVAGGWAPLAGLALFSGFYLALLGNLLKSRNAATLIVGCLLSYQVILSIESGILGFVLTIPFAAFLYPFLWWACRPHRLEDYRQARFNRSSSPTALPTRRQPPPSGHSPAS